MHQSFTPDFFAGNRRRLLATVAEDVPVVLVANGLLQRNSDATFKFRQDSSFWYLTGINQPDIIMVIENGEEYLILPGRDPVREAFDGAVTADMLTATTGITEILDETRGWERLHNSLRKAKQLATLDHGPAYADQHGFYLNPARARVVDRIRTDHAQLEILDLRSTLATMRCIKQAPELDAIRRAIALTVEGLQHITKPEQLTSYTYEYEAEADLTRHFRGAGYGHSFEPIVASGKRACQLHYIENNGTIFKDELMVFDVGAEVDMYAADISRTVAVGKVSQRQQAVFDAVCRVQDFGLARLKSGTMMREYEQLIEAEIGKELIKLGVITEASRENIRKYYPHAASHFMGLDVHDAGDYQEPLQAGMVLTCEPGIYIPEEGIGVRIEDDVLVTDDGNEVLTKALPRQLHIS